MNPFHELYEAKTVKAKKEAKQALYDLGWIEIEDKGQPTVLKAQWRCSNCKMQALMIDCPTCYKCEACYSCVYERKDIHNYSLESKKEK